MLALHKEMAWSISSPSQALQLGKESSAPSMWFNLVYQYRHIDINIHGSMRVRIPCYLCWMNTWIRKKTYQVLQEFFHHLGRPRQTRPFWYIAPTRRFLAKEAPSRLADEGRPIDPSKKAGIPIFLGENSAVRLEKYCGMHAFPGIGLGWTSSL